MDNRPRASADAIARSTDRAALTSALVGGLLIAGVIGTRCDVQVPPLAQTLTETVQPQHVQVGYQSHAVISEVSVSARDASQFAAAPEATQQPAPTQQTVGEHMRISGTDGQGVLLRTSPTDGNASSRGLLDGWKVTVLERSGDWARVRGPNNQEGWVPVRYLQQ